MKASEEKSRKEGAKVRKLKFVTGLKKRLTFNNISFMTKVYTKEDTTSKSASKKANSDGACVMKRKSTSSSSKETDAAPPKKSKNKVVSDVPISLFTPFPQKAKPRK